MRAMRWLLLSSTFAGLPDCQYLERSTNHTSETVAPPPPSAESPILLLGQTAELPTYRVKLVSQRDCGAPSATARTAYRSWAAELEVTNISPQRVAANPFYATLQDEQNFTYTTSLVGCAPLLPAKLLEPRETIRGYVPFEIPHTTPSVVLRYHPVQRGNVHHVARFRVEP
jgi:hypothetical protein